MVRNRIAGRRRTRRGAGDTPPRDRRVAARHLLPILFGLLLVQAAIATTVVLGAFGARPHDATDAGAAVACEGACCPPGDGSGTPAGPATGGRGPVVAVASASTAGSAVPWLLDTTGFPRRWNCGIWSATLGWLHIASDTAIWGAYMAIPVILGSFILKRRTPLPLVTWLFVAFIFCCGLGHLLEAVIFWQPVYRLAGVWKLVTAIVSWATVVAMIPIVPDVLRWPTMKEVNERLQDEVAERELAEHRMRRVIDAAPVGMLLVDEVGRIVMVNRELVRMVGYEQDELLGQAVEMLVPARWSATHPNLRVGFLAHATARRMGSGQALFARRKDGTEVPVDIGLTPMPTAEGGTNVLASVVDMTERRRSEEELKRLNSSLERKNRELEQFVYTASHDLKSPLLTIQGFAGWLRHDVSSGRHDRLVEFTDRIIEGTSRMRANIDDLLELSRVGLVELELERVDLTTIVQEVIRDLEGPIEEAGATIRVEEPLPTITCAPDRMRHLIENLVGNALKYGRPAAGPFEIVVSSEDRGDSVRLSVADNGPGIAPEYHEKIFGLFQRLQTDVQGTGIGLAIVARVAEVLGGRAWVESLPGEGATFHVALPKNHVDRAGSPRESTSAPSDDGFGAIFEGDPGDGGAADVREPGPSGDGPDALGPPDQSPEQSRKHGSRDGR